MNCEDKILDSNSYRWRSCEGKEAFRDEVGIVGVEDEADDADETFSDVVVAVREPVGEVKEVAHPH